MATISDSMYNTASGLVQTRGDLGQACKVLSSPVPGATVTQSCRQFEGMEEMSLWSTWKRGGSDRLAVDYPCVLEQGACPSGGPQACGKSLVQRENTARSEVFSSSDGTGYTTAAWLSCDHPIARLGKCYVSRSPVKDNVTVSQLFLDGKPALNYFKGTPFLFHTYQTPFIYMVPNAIMVRVSGLDYRVDIITAAQAGNTCY